MEEWRQEGKLKASGDRVLTGSQTIHECISAQPASDNKPSVHVLHYSLKVTPGTWADHSTADGGDTATQRDVNMTSSEQANGKDEEPVSERAKTSLELLRLLHHRAEMCGQELGGGRWQSEWLTRRLSCQLNDTLAFCSTGAALPRWCKWLPRRAAFLFSLDARRKLLDSSAFGTSHALYRLQESRVAAHRARLADDSTWPAPCCTDPGCRCSWLAVLLLCCSSGLYVLFCCRDGELLNELRAG
jgi:hypothetical protein